MRPAGRELATSGLMYAIVSYFRDFCYDLIQTSNHIKHNFDEYPFDEMLNEL